jgi:capsular exopolysaccharide synthesis family protein
MGKPFDNPGGVVVRSAVEGNAVRTEAVVEFARKKSPAHSADSYEEHLPLESSATADAEFEPLHLADLPLLSLPRAIDKPLVTANERYAREALEAYKSLRTRLLKGQASQGFRSIAVTSVGRSEGKTLTVFNLACCCAQVEKLTVLLIDGDLRNRSLSKLVRTPAVGLADVMSGTASYEQALVRTDVPNLCIMGAGRSSSQSTELFSTEKWSQVIRQSRQHFKIVLVDALSVGEFADFELIAPECDGILMVVRAHSTNREALRNAMDQIDAGKLVGVVWNGTEPSRNGLYR